MDARSGSGNKKPRKVKPVGADGHRGRMFDKYLNSMESGVNPRDIVEMLLYYPIKVRDTRDAAVYLMHQFDGDILKILNSDTDTLCKSEGIGNSCAVFLNVVGDAIRRIDSCQNSSAEQVDFKSLFEKLFLNMYSNPGNDELCVAYLDTYGTLVNTVRLDIDYKKLKASDILSLINKANHQNVTSLAVAHLTAEIDAYPTSYDAEAAKIVNSCLRYSHFTYIDYFVVNADSAISLLAAKKSN